MSHWSETSDRFWRHHLLLHCLFPSLPSPSLSSTMGVALQQDMWLVQRTVCACVCMCCADQTRWWWWWCSEYRTSVCSFSSSFPVTISTCDVTVQHQETDLESVCVSHPGRMWFLLNICSGADITSCFYVSEVLVKHFNWITSQTSRWLVSLVDLWVS